MPQERYYLIAIGGTAMAPLAGLLAERGEQVTGSDFPLYPPMSDRIAALGIEVRPAFAAGNLPADLDEVVVGNLASGDNPELQEALRRGLRVRSMPRTLHDEFLAGRHPVVVAGTHGKTTTSALAAWVLASAGRQPGYLIGGEPLNFEAPYTVGQGPAFVVEGDEYSTSWDDKGPKFLHYAPRTLLLTSVEFDHADLYADLEDVKAAFRKVVALVPPDGRIVANGDDPNVLDVLDGARARIYLYRVFETPPGKDDEGAEPDLAALILSSDATGSEMVVSECGRPILTVRLPMGGRHNVGNALAAIGAARAFDLSGAEIAAGLASFRGVKRRLEERGTVAGVTVLDDFAHHPTAVAATVRATRQLYPGRRLWGVFEPRSMTAGRAEFASRYLEALLPCDGVAMARPFHAARLARSGGPGALDVEALAARLTAEGREAFAAADPAALAEELAPRLREGDVVLVMSSGSFGGLHGKLLEALTQVSETA